MVEAAVKLLHQVGLDGLTTRRLAASLGVQSPALYWYIRSKEELLDLVAEAICAESLDQFAVIEQDTSLSWRQQLEAQLREFRRLLLAHRDAFRLLAERPPSGPNRLRLSEATANTLFRAGFNEQEVAGLAVLLVNYVIGMVSEEVRQLNQDTAHAQAEMTEFLGAVQAHPGDYPSLARLAPYAAAADPQALFALGLDVLFSGLQSPLAKHTGEH